MIDTALGHFKTHIEQKAFMRGLIAVGILYVIMLVIGFISTGGVIHKREAELAFTTAEVEIPAPIKKARRAEKSDHQRSQEVLEKGGQLSTLEVIHGLPPAPIQGLYELTTRGALPVIRKQDNLSVFDAYKRPFDFKAAEGKYIIALLIRDFGLSKELSEKILAELPADVSLMLNPYSKNAKNWVRRARENGHEIWLDVPTERENFPIVDYGPQILMSRLSLVENQGRLNSMLAKAQGYVGIASYFDKIFETSQTMLQRVISITFDRGIGFMDLNPHAPGLNEALALKLEKPYIRSSGDITTIEGLSLLEERAKEYGFAVGTLDLYPNTYDDLNTWIDGLKKRGFILAPSSSLASAPTQHRVKISTKPQEISAPKTVAPTPDESLPHNPAGH